MKIAEQDWGAQACCAGVPDADRVWRGSTKWGLLESAQLLIIGSLGSTHGGTIGRSVDYYMLGRAELALLIYVDDLLWLIREKQGLELIPFDHLLSGASLCLEKVQRRFCPFLGRLRALLAEREDWIVYAVHWQGEDC